MTQVIDCVIDKCDWSHTIAFPDPRINEATLADIFGPGVFAATANAKVAHDAEQAIAAHYRTHTPFELFETCARRTVELNEARAATAAMYRLLHPEPGDRVFGYHAGGRAEGVLMSSTVVGTFPTGPDEAVIGFEHDGRTVQTIVFRDSVRGLG